jgi:hypothetical protein
MCTLSLSLLKTSDMYQLGTMKHITHRTTIVSNETHDILFASARERILECFCDGCCMRGIYNIKNDYCIKYPFSTYMVAELTSLLFQSIHIPNWLFT